MNYKCINCGWVGDKNNFEIKLLSIMYREKKDSFEALHHVKCPQCKSAVTIIFETISSSVNR